MTGRADTKCLEEDMQHLDEAEMRDLIPTGEALTLLGVTRNTLTAWVKRGLIRAYTMGTRRFYVKAELLKLPKPIHPTSPTAEPD